MVIMNWKQVQGNRKQFTDKVKEKWGELTDDEIDQIAGKRYILLGKIREKCGIAQVEARGKSRTVRRPTVDRW